MKRKLYLDTVIPDHLLWSVGTPHLVHGPFSDSLSSIIQMQADKFSSHSILVHLPLRWGQKVASPAQVQIVSAQLKLYTRGSLHC